MNKSIVKTNRRSKFKKSFERKVKTSNLEPFTGETLKGNIKKSVDLNEQEFDAGEIKPKDKRGKKEKSKMELSKAGSSCSSTSSPQTTPLVCGDTVSPDNVFTETSDDDNQTCARRQYLKKNVNEYTRKRRTVSKVSTGSESSLNTSIPQTDNIFIQNTTCEFFDDFNMLEATTSTAHKKRNPRNVSASDVTMDPSLMSEATTSTTHKKHNPNKVSTSDLTMDPSPMFEATTSTAHKKTNVSASDLTMDPSLMLEATTSTAHKKRNPSIVLVDLATDPSPLQGGSKKKTKKQSKSNNTSCSIEILNFDETLKNEDRLKTALKEFKFIKNGDETWTDANTHVFNGNDIADEDDEKRGTYNLEKSIIDLDTLKSLCENGANVSTVQAEKKRSSIGQRISKKKGKRSPSPKLSIGFKAKAKLQKFRRSKEHIESAMNSFSTSLLDKCKKNVAFNTSVSSINFSKIKRTKMPNFAQIHQRQQERSENIVDYVERTNERAKLLLSGTKLTLSHNQSIKHPTVAKRNLLDSLASEKKEFNKSENVKSVGTPPPLKKKGVTYATPPVNQCKSPKTFAKTPGKNILGKKPTTPARATSSREPLEICVKTPQKEVLTKTPLKTPKNRIDTTSSGAINHTSINSPVQPSTSNAQIYNCTLPPKLLASNTTQEKLFTTKKQAAPNKPHCSIPKTSKIPIRIKGASNKISATQTTTTTAVTSKVIRTATEKGNKENKQAAANNRRVGFKARPDRGILKVVVANKTWVPKVDNIEDRRKNLKGVRSNRRFDLLMKLRNN